jgi:hypothetical protein
VHSDLSEEILKLKYECGRLGFNREGLIMAMGPKKRGIWQNNRSPGPVDPRDPALVDRVADFSYTSNEMALLITEIWLNPATYAGLFAPNTYANRSGAAKTALGNRGIHLTKPIVITEKEYDEGFSLGSAGLAPEGVVLVVPDASRASGSTVPGGPSLLETAKMLMAVTPNGI